MDDSPCGRKLVGMPRPWCWRLEFEIKREVLTQKGLAKLSEVMYHLNGLWDYATTEWLRLTLPNADDKTRSRWPIHPLWLLSVCRRLGKQRRATRQAFQPEPQPQRRQAVPDRLQRDSVLYGQAWIPGL